MHIWTAQAAGRGGGVGEREAKLEVKSSCCSGSVGHGHAARAHRLNSSADSNCPSVFSLEKHVSRRRRRAARARYQSWSWFGPSKREAQLKPAVRAWVTVSTLVLTTAEAKPKWHLVSTFRKSTRCQQHHHTKTEDAFMAFSYFFSKTEVLYFQCQDSRLLNENNTSTTHPLTHAFNKQPCRGGISISEYIQHLGVTG